MQETAMQQPSERSVWREQKWTSEQAPHRGIQQSESGWPNPTDGLGRGPAARTTCGSVLGIPAEPLKAGHICMT